MPATLHAIVPLLNEAPNLPALLASFARLQSAIAAEFRLSVIFVDDGSNDDTAGIIERARPGFKQTVLRHESNRGPGAAFATGFKHLAPILAGEDWVMTLEGDNTSDIATIQHMLTRRREGYDVVLASPYLYGGGFSKVSLHRILISHLGNGLVKLVLGIRGVQTFSSFLRLYSAPMIARLQASYGPGIIEFCGFECMTELLAKLIGHKARISEVEQVVDWSKRAGASKMRIVRTSIGYLRLMARWISLR